jgi:peroxiredoxin
MNKPLPFVASTLLLVGLSAIASAQQMNAMVPNAAAEAKPLSVGASVPDSVLGTLQGKRTTFKRALHGRPTVMIFYRGSWCPFCNGHLMELGKIEGEIRRRGYQIIAISPDEAVELNKMREKNQLPYQLYSDSSAELMKKFGVAFRLDDDTFDKYKNSYHIDLEKASGHTHHILPVPSVFVVDRKGKIVFVHSNPDYKVRMKASELLSALPEIR